MLYKKLKNNFEVHHPSLLPQYIKYLLPYCYTVENWAFPFDPPTFSYNLIKMAEFQWPKQVRLIQDSNSYFQD